MLVYLMWYTCNYFPMSIKHAQAEARVREMYPAPHQTSWCLGSFSERELGELRPIDLRQFLLQCGYVKVRMCV